LIKFYNVLGSDSVYQKLSKNEFFEILANCFGCAEIFAIFLTKLRIWKFGSCKSVNWVHSFTFPPFLRNWNTSGSPHKWGQKFDVFGCPQLYSNPTSSLTFQCIQNRAIDFFQSNFQWLLARLLNSPFMLEHVAHLINTLIFIWYPWICPCTPLTIPVACTLHIDNPQHFQIIFKMFVESAAL
jgi:hypothetical protein